MKNNHVVLSGVLLEDAELSEAKEGTARCTFKIIVPKYNNKQGCIELSLFGLSAKAWQPHLYKDRPVDVIGHLDQTVREHEKKTFTNLYLAIEDIRLKPDGDSEELYVEDELIIDDDGDPTIAEAERLGL
jgi:hypothetical protein